MDGTQEPPSGAASGAPGPRPTPDGERQQLFKIAHRQPKFPRHDGTEMWSVLTR